MAETRRITNKDLHERLRKVELALKGVVKWMNDTRAGEKAVDKYRANHPISVNGNSITLPKEVLKIIFYLAGAIFLFLGGKTL